MNTTEYSITRTKATWKPRITDADIPFFKCDTCGCIFAGVSSNEQSVFSGTGRSLVAEPSYLHVSAPVCCGQQMSRVGFLEKDDLPESISLDYRFEGGFNNNCLKISWSVTDTDYAVEWVCVKTFTGMQTKYVLPKKRSPLIFAFADEDAFCYCDKNPCVECKFRCKAGMVAYVSVEGAGVVRMPLDRMVTPHPISSSDAPHV